MPGLILALMLQTTPAAPSAAEQAAIKRYFDADLLDGPSARWKWPPRLNAESYCGWVNAKNRMGAYTGWTPFYVMRGKDGKLRGGISGKSSEIMFEFFCTNHGYNITTPPRD